MVVALLALAPGWASAATLTRVDEILHLSEQALRQHPAVRVRGVVTYYRPEGLGDLVIQDDSGGIFVNRATTDVVRTLRPGAVVELKESPSKEISVRASTPRFTPCSAPTRCRTLSA